MTRLSMFMSPLGVMPSLTEWEDNDTKTNITLCLLAFACVCFAGICSGLTIGLMSIDVVDLEVLKRSGTDTEKRYASQIMPVVSNAHFLLVTLLLCNAGAMESLPLVLDRLFDPITAILLSVTAVLLFGEIIPQAACARHGLAIGAYLAKPVLVLMLVCSPVAWPIGKLLDYALGANHPVLFRRKQLKTLVDLHGEEGGLGGKLSADETKIIAGALDLTHKIAYRSMTPLDTMFMLSTDDVLDEPTLKRILQSGHSRIPVFGGGDRSSILGLILVKELIQYKMSHPVSVSMIRLRSLPRLVATTPMYDLLKLFQTGRSHMAVLTQPPRGWRKALRTTSMGLHMGDTSHTHISDNDAASIEDHLVAAAIDALSEAEADAASDPDMRAVESNGDLAGHLATVQGAGYAAGGFLPEEENFFAHKGHAVGVLPDTADAGVPDVVEATGTSGDLVDVPKQITAKRSSVPIAEPGQPIGIITIEDVIEELISSEIVDETDEFVDNYRRIKVDVPGLVNSLPERLRAIISAKVVAAAAAGGGGGGGGTTPKRGAHAVQRSELSRPLLGGQH